jgi:hypothetical protein
MNILSLSVFFSFLCTTGAFTSPINQNHQVFLTKLNSRNEKPWAPAVAAFITLTMASQIALAAPIAVDQTQAKNPLSFLVEEKPPPVYEKLDFSLPSYDTASKATGFGEGKFVRNLEGASSEESSEVDKQRDAMLKAEAARKARLQQAKELAKMREEEDQARAQAKREEASRRLRGIFD